MVQLRGPSSFLQQLICQLPRLPSFHHFQHSCNWVRELNPLWSEQSGVSGFS